MTNKAKKSNKTCCHDKPATETKKKCCHDEPKAKTEDSKCCHGNGHGHGHRPKELPTNLAANEEVIYICPMDLEIRQAGPGSCPICGMALEPEVVTISDKENPELTDFKKRLLIASLFAVPLLIIEIALVSSAFFTNIAEQVRSIFPNEVYMRVVMLILSSPVVLYSAWPFFHRAWMSFTNLKLNMFSLLGLGIGIAYFFSFIVTVFNIEGQYVYFGTAAFITVLTLLGQVIELKAREKTSDAIKSLLELSPTTAVRIGKKGKTEEIDVSEVQIGDRLLIRAYDKIPVDGEVISGTSYVDQSSFSGESEPRKVKVSDIVYASSSNLSGNFEIIAKKVGKDTLLSQIIQQVSNAQRSKSPSQKLADTVASYFVPSVMLVSVLSFIYWYFTSSFEFALVSAISVLIVACPCALGLATPISISQGMGLAAKNGILVKNAVILEGLSRIKKIVLDKTGTLTEGKISITNIALFSKFSKKEVLSICYKLEESSVHPIALAFIHEAKKSKVAKSKSISKIKASLGSGILATYKGKQKVLLGNQKLIEKSSIKIPANKDTEASQIFLAVNGTLIAGFTLKDKIKSNAKQMIMDLNARQVETIVLSGDTAKTTSKVAKELGISHFIADVLPTDKGRYIEKFKEDGLPVAMVGDGVNDAPALAIADVGIAMASGSSVAVENSDVTLLGGNLSKILSAFNLSKIVRYNIVQNLFFAFIYNGLGIPIAAGLFYTSFNLSLNPVFASFAMASSSICVILNAVRITGKKI